MVVQPFTQLYLRGPTALGFWGGLPLSNVCARLTQTDTNFWARSDDAALECQLTIDREIDAWLMVLAALLYCMATYSLFAILIAACRPRPHPAAFMIKNLPVGCIAQEISQ
jgi:hypothetical protein